MQKLKKYLIGGYFAVIFGIFTLILTFIVFLFGITVTRFYLIFTGLSLIFLGYLDIRHVHRYIQQGQTYYFIPEGRMYITKRRIKNWERNNLVEGLGTQLNPYKFTQPERIPPFIRIYIKNVKVYFHIENCSFETIILTWCKNLIIENCKIRYIELSYCKDVSITNNLIGGIHLDKSNGNSFVNNELHNDVMKYLKDYKISFPLYETITGITVGLISFSLFNYLNFLYQTPIKWILIINAFLAILFLAIFFGSKYPKKLDFYFKMRGVANKITDNVSLTHPSLLE